MTDPRSARSLAEVFAAQALLHPERPALSTDGGRTRTYRELAGEAGALAAALARNGVRLESRVVIVGGRTAETVIAILGVLRAGGACCVVDPRTPAARLRLILEDLAPAAAVIAEYEFPRPASGDFPCPVLCLARDSAAAPAARPRPSCDPSALAYVLFTSGSTGRPKGVMVEHGGVLNMLRSYERLAPLTDGFAGALVAPTAFDVSVWEVFSTLAYGGTLHVPTDARLSGGDELWDFLCDAGIESAYIPPGLVAPIAAAAEHRRGALKRVLVGVEPIPQGVLQRFRDACPGLRVVNGYGPTETTITATLHLLGDVIAPDQRTPIGRPVAGSRVEIVREDFAPAQRGDIGEILVFGDCLARGYLNDADTGFMIVGGARAYRTGDYGRYLADGTIEFVGRCDRQLKINGFRVELGEVEAALLGAPAVRHGIVMAAGETGAWRLVAAVEALDHVRAADVRAHLAKRLPAHAIPSRIIVLQALPRTANGKVDASALLAADRDRPADAPAYTEPEADWRRAVAAAWSAVLGVAEVGVDDDFHRLGGGSLDAVRIAARLRDRGYQVRASAILAARTVRRLALPARTADGPTAVAPGVYPASRAHEGLWAWREMNPESARTTIVLTIRLDGVVDPARLERAVRAAVARHEALRTTFEMRLDRTLAQHVAAPPPWELLTREITVPEEVDREIETWLEHRFDLAAQPWTASLLLSDGFGALVFAADHLVFDGESSNILLRDVARAYDDPAGLGAAEPGPASFAPLSSPASGRLLELRAWWDRELEGFEAQAVLPEPLTRGPHDRRLRRLETIVDDSTWKAIVAAARSAGTTTFAVVLAALKSFLRARSGSENDTVCVALSRRHALGCEDAVGHFVNLIPIRDRLAVAQAESSTFADYLAQVSERFGAAIEHGDLPFEEMIARLARPASACGASPARVVLVQQTLIETVETESGVRFAPWSRQPSNAIYDLTIFISESSGSSPARLEWCWVPGSTLERALAWMAEAFLAHLNAAASAPETRLSALPTTAPAEDALIAAAATPWEPTARARRGTLVSLFRTHTELRPDAVAVEGADGTVTYRQLAERAATIGRAIAARTGRGPVVVALDKSVDQLATILAAVMSGSPYLPLDPAHARKRLPDFAVRSCARVCVTHSRHAEAIRTPDGCPLVLVDALAPSEPDASPRPPWVQVEPDDIAYIMPTSGSTGVPKLVGVPHRAVVRLVHRSDSLPLDETDRTMLIANSSFDAATFEIWGALANGGRVITPTCEELREPALLAAAIERHGVTAAFFTTTFFERLLDVVDRLKGMRHVIVGGEVVPPRLFAAAADAIPRDALVNGYGPTENTTFSCCFRLDRDPGQLRSLPIGRPISGSGAIVVDEALRPVPPGTPGEILVTGDGLAVGYVDDPRLTELRFVPLVCLDGARAYRTGDLGRLLPDGVFEYLGRRDRQLKIRGFRVEPGEVEAVLSTHPDVRSSVVFAADLGGMRALHAAVQATGLSESDVRAWLAVRVPDYLIPTRIHVVDQLPMTSNGKLDHASLREMARAPRPVRDAAPRTALEREIAAIVAPLLGVPDVGLDEDFFDLGANSMTVLTLTAGLGDRLGQPVANHFVYSAPTVRSLAWRIEAKAEAGDSAAAQRVRDRAAQIRFRTST